MKRKDIKELSGKTQEELKKLLEETQISLVKLKMDLKTAKTKNVRAVSRKRDEIAQILTKISEKKALEEK
ncbi:MAG: 50S ribosomal protein L29 [Patescibacteria group bacterium]